MCKASIHQSVSKLIFFLGGGYADLKGNDHSKKTNAYDDHDNWSMVICLTIDFW